MAQRPALKRQDAFWPNPATLPPGFVREAMANLGMPMDRPRRNSIRFDNPATLPIGFAEVAMANLTLESEKSPPIWDLRLLDVEPASPPPSPKDEDAEEPRAVGVPLAREIFSRLSACADKIRATRDPRKWLLFRQRFREMPVAINAMERWHVDNIIAALIISRLKIEKRSQRLGCFKSRCLHL